MSENRERDSIGDATTFRGAYQDIRIGVCIGPNDRYEITDNLGRGGMGEVFLARDKVSGIEVAIKLIPREVSLSEDEMEQIRKNFALVQKLHHPNIAAVTHLELLAVSGEYFLVMEAVPGRRTLHKERLSREDEKLPVDEAIRVCEQIAAALDYAHSQKVLHRDVKPANVMIAPDGRVKLTDFGLTAQIVSSMTRVTRMAVNTSGTRPYMAPEQWESRLQDEKTDQWSLGVMFYELVSGWPAFASSDIEILERQVLTKAPRKPDELSESPWEALNKALSKEKDDRFGSCVEFVNSLGAPAEVPRPKRAKSKARPLVAVAAIVAILGVGGYLVSLQMQGGPAAKEETRNRLAADEAAGVAEEEQRAAAVAEEQRRREEAERQRVEQQREETRKRLAAEKTARQAAEEKQKAAALALERRQREEAELAAQAEEKARAEEDLRKKLAASEAKVRAAEAKSKRLAQEKQKLEDAARRKIEEQKARSPIITEDGFTSHRKGWSVSSNEYSTTSFEGRRYIFQVHHEGTTFSSLNSPEIRLPDNYDIELTSTWRSGVRNQPYGIHVGTKHSISPPVPREYYFFGVSADGSSVVRRNRSFKDKSPDPIASKSNTARTGDTHQANTQRIEVRGRGIHFYVNGVYIGSIVSEFDVKLIGVGVDNRQTVAFESMKIVRRD